MRAMDGRCALIPCVSTTEVRRATAPGCVQELELKNREILSLQSKTAEENTALRRSAPAPSRVMGSCYARGGRISASRTCGVNRAPPRAGGGGGGQRPLIKRYEIRWRIWGWKLKSKNCR